MEVLDTFRIILTHLDAKDLRLISTVNKQWCYEANSSKLWRELFFKNSSKNHSSDAEEMQLAALLKDSSTQICDDWKRAYMIKLHYRARHPTLLCLPKCLREANDFTVFLEPHGNVPEAYQSLMFEKFSTKVLERKSSPKPSKEEVKPELGLFQQVLAMLGEDVHRAWMILDASRSDDLADWLSKEYNAIYTTLMGSFFNVLDTHCFPYLVKVDSCLSFCEHVYNTSGGQWCYLMVEHPSLQSHIDSVWYLNIDKNLYPTKEIKTMAFLRRHLMKFYTWFKDFFFRVFSRFSITMMLHVYNRSMRDELFNEITTEKTTPVINYYLLVDKRFFSGKIGVVRPDFVPSIKAEQTNLKYHAEIFKKFHNLSYWLLLQGRIKKYWRSKIPPDADLIPQIEILSQQGWGVFKKNQLLYCLMYFGDPKFFERPDVQELSSWYHLPEETRKDLIVDIWDKEGPVRPPKE